MVKYLCHYASIRQSCLPYINTSASLLLLWDKLTTVFSWISIIKVTLRIQSLPWSVSKALWRTTPVWIKGQTCSNREQNYQIPATKYVSCWIMQHIFHKQWNHIGNFFGRSPFDVSHTNKMLTVGLNFRLMEFSYVIVTKTSDSVSVPVTTKFSNTATDILFFLSGTVSPI